MHRFSYLREFLENDSQKQLLDALDATDGNVMQAAELLGKHYRNVQRHLQHMKMKVALKGVSPDNDMVHSVPQGYNVEGVSTLYDSEGKPSAQWVKSKLDKNRQAELVIEAIENATELLKPFKPTKAPATHDDDLLTLLVLTDFHLGMYAWEPETGEAWDIKIAERVLLNAINDMINGSPKSKIGMLCNLGDFLHWDGVLAAVTPISSNFLDADTRYSKLVDLTMTVVTNIIRMMLKRYEKVVVINAEGNHDVSGSVWLRKFVKHLFSDEPRVEVIDNEFPYYAYLHGDVMLGFHHGHKMRLQNLHKLFASEPRFRSMWGEAKYTWIHTGHYHHEKVIEDGGAIAEQHPTLASKDAYSARGGWMSQRGAKAITYHKTDGEISRITVRPRDDI